MKRLICGLMCCLYIPTLFAQTESDVGQYVYKQKVTPLGIDNYLFFYLNVIFLFMLVLL